MLIYVCKLKGVELRAIKMKNELEIIECKKVEQRAEFFCLVLKTKARTYKKMGRCSTILYTRQYIANFSNNLIFVNTINLYQRFGNIKSTHK